MTIKEAIKHCYEVLERNDLCEECKKEHLQLANWLEQLEKLEKELKQTKSNFKNSQTHSKHCYKKLKNDMNRLIKIIKDYSFITNYDMAWGVNCEDEEFLRKILK